MRYGLPYMGSKNKIAEEIVAMMPKRKHLYDLFMGGGSITHCAMIRNKFEEYHVNDINWMCTQLFKDAIEGKYRNEDRWISREDFERLKDSDPYVAFVWSFGNNLRTYLYNKDIEALKKAMHYAIYFGDYSLGKELGFDMSVIDGIKGVHKRYLRLKKHLNSGGVISDTSPWSERKPCGDSGGAKLQPSVTQCHSRSGRIGESASTEKMYAISAWRATHGHRQYPISGGGKIQCTNLSYQDVEILPDSVIYLDPPYKGTYGYKDAEDFDHDAFYDWASKQTEPTLISEYYMPEDRFTCIKEIHHTNNFSQTKVTQVTERIFVPNSQIDYWNTKTRKQLELFT